MGGHDKNIFLCYTNGVWQRKLITLLPESSAILHNACLQITGDVGRGFCRRILPFCIPVTNEPLHLVHCSFNCFLILGFVDIAIIAPRTGIIIFFMITYFVYLCHTKPDTQVPLRCCNIRDFQSPLILYFHIVK